MKKRTSSMSRRIVSLLMSMVLTLTLVTPAAFATEVVDGSGTTIVEGDTNPADVNTSGDNEGKDDENKDTEHGGDEQPTNPGDEDKNPGEGEGDDANKPDEDKKDEAPDGENKDEENKDEENKNEQPTEDENNGDDEIAPLNAENGTDVWAGADAEVGIDTSWYTNDTTVSTFYISTAAQLAGLAKLVNEGNNFSKKFIKLTADILLNELDKDGMPRAAEGQAEAYKWTPIGNSAQKKFQGTFDGDGYTVSGVYIKADKANFQGLFGFSTGTVKNLIVTGNITATNAMNIGGVVGINNNGNVINCGFYGGINKTPKRRNCGGVVGGGTAANVKNCWFYKTDGNVPESDVVGTKGASNCAGITEKGSDLTTVNTNIDCNTKVWIWTEDKLYPVLGTPAREITIEPIFADCAATVSVNDTELNVNNDYTYEVTGDVTITASIEGICYGKEGATGNDLTPITSSGVSYTGPFPATLFYGTEDDFDALTAWNSALVGNTATINDAAALKALARMVNSGTVSTQGMTITLNEDIDLSGIKDWTPIGTENYPFRGTFNGNKKTISNLAGDLFGVVEGGTIRQVSIDAGRMVRLLKSSSDWRKGGIVEYCRAINVNGDTASIDSLVGKIKSVTVKNSAGKDMLIVSSVSSSYVYDSKKPGIPVVEAKDELSTVTNCFYLADQSTFGSTADENGENGDTGARTEDEFAAGRVTWELNGKADGFKGRNTYLSWGMSDNEPKVPKLARIKVGAPGCVYELTLTKVYAPPAKDIRLEGGEDVTVFQNGDTWYAYCVWASNKTFSVEVDTTSLESGDMVSYGTNGEPTKITRIEASAEAAKNAYFYTIGGKIEADIDWYVGHENEDTYILKNAAEMFGFAALVNGTAKDKDGKEIPSKGFDGKTVELANDIDLSNCPWTPIGFTDSIVFQGTFNGGGHRVKGLLVAANIRYAGLFGRLKGAGTVRNVQVEGSVDATYTSGGTFYVGGIVGQLAGSGTVSNCLSKVDVTATSSNNAVSAGGVVGDAVSGSKINLCWNEGSVQVTGVVVGSAVGGVVGSAATATNCANFGAVTSNCATGGIAGSINEASNCYNLGTVTGAEGKTHNISNGTVVNSYYADIAGKTGIYVNNGSDTTKADTTEITITEEENGKLTYKVTMDSAASDLVEVLNDNTPTAANIEKWINKLSTPYNPVHMTRWDGNPEPGAQEGVVSITYDPGTATVGTAVSDSKLLKEEEASWTFTLKTADDLGFKHENGTFLGWSTQSDAAVPEYTFGGEAPTITVTKEQKNVILYAVWKNIWSGDGSKDSPYQISNAEKLTALQTQVNDKGFNYKGKYFAITGTIDLGNESWTPIGNGKASFAGSIEGNGNTITGLYVTEETRAGLFEILGVDGTSTYIRNLTICGQVTVDHGHAGGLTAVMGHGTITLEKITTDVTVRVENLNYYASPLGSAGGLIGYNVANAGATYNVVKVIKCINKGSIYGVTAGGIAGANNSSNAANQYTLEDCTNEGTVTGLLYAGGILGGSTNSTATRCENSGTVKATGTTGTRGYAGGICATNLRWAKRCVNTGEVCGQYAGGIAYGLSSTYGGEAKYCLNKGNITGTRIAAGIAVYGKKADISGIGGVSFSYNLGEIKGSTDAYSYGIAQGGTIKNCFTYNEAKHVAISANNKLVTNSYYLADSAGDFPATYGGEWASADDFSSGKVAWGVGGKGEGSQGGTGQDAKLGWWKQDKNDEYPTLLPTPDMSKRYYRTDVDCGTGGEVELTRNASNTVKELSSKEAVYGPAGTSVTIKATPKDNTMGLKSLTWTHNGQTDTLPTKGTPSIVIPAESNVTIHAEFASVGPGGNGGYYYGGSGDGTGTGDKDDEGLQDGLNMDVEYDIKGLVLGAYAEWGSNGGNKSFQKWLEENPNVVRALLTNSLDNMATAAVGKKTDEAKDLAALLLASLNEHTGVDGKDGDTIAKALQKYIDSGSEEVFSAWLTGGGGMASGTYESIYGQYASSLAALADRLYSKWEASGTSMTFPVWLDSQQVSMDSLSENADEPDTDNANDPQTSDAPDDVPDGQDTEGGASGNSVWEIIGTVVRENPIIVWSIVAVIVALIIVGAVRRYHKVKRDEHDEK